MRWGLKTLLSNNYKITETLANLGDGSSIIMINLQLYRNNETERLRGKRRAGSLSSGGLWWQSGWQLAPRGLQGFTSQASRGRHYQQAA